MEGNLGAAPVEPRETTIDELGDLLVDIVNDDGNKRFLVDSNALARVSETWKTLIRDSRDAHDANGPRDTKLVVSVKGDPGFHHLLFRIMHGDFESVPEELTESQLFDLLSLTEEYQIRLSLLRSWIGTWVETLPTWLILPPYEIKRLYNRLWVAWTLGDINMFNRLLTIFVREVVPANLGAELEIFGKPLPRTPEIPGLFGYLRQERAIRIDQLLDVFERQLDLRVIGQVRYCHFDELPDTEKSMCDLIVAGSILRNYIDQVLLASGFHERCQSVKVTYDRLKSIKIQTYACTPADGAPAPPAGQTHDGRCNPTAGLHEELKAYYEVEGLGPSFLEHLERQSTLTGLDRFM